MSVKNQNAADTSGINKAVNPEYESPKGGSSRGATIASAGLDSKTSGVKPDSYPQERREYQRTMVKRIVTTSVVLLGLSIVLSHADKIIDRATTSSTTLDGKLPPQSVFIDPKSFAVLPDSNGANSSSFRTDSFTQLFNPTNTSTPIFQIFNLRFLGILGPNPSIREIAHNATFAFAHEAPIYVSESDEVFFASNDGGPLGMSDLERNNKVFKIRLGDVKNGEGDMNVPVTEVPLPESIQMTNGGTGPFKGNLILINSGRGDRAPSIALVNPNTPHNATVLLNNYYGRQFSSLNDIKVHPSGKLFFTDVIYGFLNHFRPDPLMRSQVYRFDPDTGAVRVVATDFDKPNGIAFTKDGRTAYIADTGASGGFLGNNLTEPATLYAFDVDPRTHAFTNRRVLAYVDAGVPDGIQVDTQGNVYTACADGVQVFAPDGTLLGKFFTNMSSANMVFAPPDRLVILAETKVFLAKIAARGVV